MDIVLVLSLLVLKLIALNYHRVNRDNGYRFGRYLNKNKLSTLNSLCLLIAICFHNGELANKPGNSLHIVIYALGPSFNLQPLLIH